METIFRPTKRGTVFDSATGKLYLFAPGSITVMLAWPPVTWKKIRSNPHWVHVRPKICVPCRGLDGRIERLSAPPADENGQLLLPFCSSPEQERECREDMAWLNWYAMIPEPVREVVSRFPERQWHMLSLIARCGDAAMDLAVANPALAWALASSWCFRPRVQRPLRSARALLKAGKKQREIIDWLGFPATEAVRKMLRKVVHKAINVSALLYLRQSMADPAVAKALAHVPRVNRGVIRIVTDSELLRFVSPTLLEEISFSRDNDKRPKAAWLLQDSLNMAQLLRVGRDRFAHLKSLARLVDLHDSLVDDVGHARLQDIDLVFPSPPIQGTDTIIALTTARDLIEEGRHQRNCVASYIDRVALRQRTYIYRTIPPLDRCTLSIMKRGSKWVLGELKRACNLPPTETTRRAVLHWLSESQTTHLTDEHVGPEPHGLELEREEYLVADDGPLPEPPDDGIPL